MNKYALLAALWLVACGSDDGDPPPLPEIERPAETTGSFYDSVVIGLDYQRTAGDGVTDDSGYLDIAIGEDVGFSVGTATLGTATASAVMMPLDLVEGGDLNSPRVINVTRFLLAIDVDGDPANGVQITPALRNLADVWTIDFDLPTGDFAGEVVAELGDASSVNTVDAVLPTAEDATAHLQETFYCAHSGAFSGTSIGEDGSERVLTIIIPSGGAGIRASYSNTRGGQAGTLRGDAMAVARARSFTVTDDDTDETLMGGFASAHWLEGTWESASFSAARMGFQDDARWRFTGTTSFGDDFSIDIDAAGNVVGALQLAGGPALASAAMTGNFREGTGQFSANAMVPLGDREFEGTVTLGEVPRIEGTFFGNGTFAGDGCRLR